MAEVNRGPLNGNLSAQQRQQIEAQRKAAEAQAEIQRQLGNKAAAERAATEAQNLGSWFKK